MNYGSILGAYGRHSSRLVVLRLFGLGLGVAVATVAIVAVVMFG